MSKAGFCQLLSVIFLAAFIAFSLSGDEVTSKTAAEIAKEVTAVVTTEGLTEFDKLKFEEQFGFDSESFESWSYYASDDIMNVREILIIKVGESENSDEIESVIEKRAEDKYNTFKDYDPVASSLLKNRVIKKENGVIFYLVDADASEGAEVFLESITD